MSSMLMPAESALVSFNADSASRAIALSGWWASV
jgi:hypothetical protein